MTEPGPARFMLHVSYKPADTDWLGSHGLAGAGRGHVVAPFRGRGPSVRQLTVLGFPAAGPPLLDRADAAGVRRPLPVARPDALAATAPGARMSEQPSEPWWKSGVLYQIYPRSFADSNGDGVGDLPGIIAHLDHLEWLGVDGIWLSPVTVSPNADWGYDVADFCAVAPEFGTLDDLDRLVAEAGRRGIRVLLDLVPNHTSDQHPWFVDSRSSRTSASRDWYVWADPKPDGSPPNNWVSSFGGPAWTLDAASGQYFLHNHLEEQPDLNWWNEEVRAAFDDIIRVLVRPRRGRVPHRCVQHHHQGRRAARQPAGHRGRRLRGADVRAALRLQRQPARGARGHPALAGPGRHLRRAPAS